MLLLRLFTFNLLKEYKISILDSKGTSFSSVFKLILLDKSWELLHIICWNLFVTNNMT